MLECLICVQSRRCEIFASLEKSCHDIFEKIQHWVWFALDGWVQRCWPFESVNPFGFCSQKTQYLFLVSILATLPWKCVAIQPTFFCPKKEVKLCVKNTFDVPLIDELRGIDHLNICQSVWILEQKHWILTFVSTAWHF